MARSADIAGAATRGSRESWAPTAGFLAVGASAFAMLAAGPRILGDAGYSGLAVSWTVATIFGFGLAIPAEQTITRRIAGGGYRVGVWRIRIMLLAATLPVGLAWALALGGRPVAGVDDPLWWFAAWVAAAGWALVIGPRGRLAGRGNFGGYAIVLITDGACRIILVSVALMVPAAWQTSLLAAAVGVPIVVAAGVAWAAERRGDHVAQPTAERGVVTGAPVIPGVPGEHASLTVVAAAMQVLLNTGPLWLAARPGVAAATAGLFVSVTSYMRIPALLTGGAMTVVLSRTSGHFARGELLAVRKALLDHLKPILLITGLATVALVALAPVGLTLLYGPNHDVRVATLVLIGGTTVMFGVANIATQTVVGMRGATAAAWIWSGAAVVTSVFLAVLPATITGASWAILAGVLVGSVGVAWRVRALFVGGAESGGPAT